MFYLRWFFLSALFLVLHIDLGFAQKTANVDLLLKREKLGAVLVNEKTNTVYIERIRSFTSSSTPLPYTGEFAIHDAMKKIDTVPLDGTQNAEPLFDHEENAGYWFAGNDPRSPDERYWGILRLKNGILNPGYYDTKLKLAKFFDLPLVYSTHTPPFLWVSNYEIIARVQGGGGDSKRSFDLLIQDMRDQAQARETAWRKRQVTSALLGGGRYSYMFPKENPTRFVRYNLLTGHTKAVSEGAFTTHFLISQDKSLLATYERYVDRSNQGGNDLTRLGIKADIVILNTRGGEHDRIRASADESFWLHSWSKQARYLLIKRSFIDDRGLNTIFSVYDAKAKLIKFDLPSYAVDPYWVNDVVVYKTKLDRNGHQNIGATLINGQNKVLSHEIETKKVELVAASENSVYALLNGDIWRLGIDSSTDNLTSDLVWPLALHQIKSRETVRYDFFAKSQLPDLSKAIFQFERDSQAYLARFCEKRLLLFPFQAPSDNELTIQSTTEGVIFLSNKNNSGSKVLYSGTDKDNDHSSILLRYNQHLAGVETARAPIKIDYAGSENEDLIGWLYLPPKIKFGQFKKHPLVVIPYAGTVYGETPLRGSYAASIWDLDLSVNTLVEIFAAEGYAVLLPSIPLGPRGEAGDPMMKMLPPILSAVDAAIETGHVDPNRLALSGQSFGGYTALSVAVQTNRFNAIIAMASVSNLTSQYGQFIPYTRYNTGSFSLDVLTHAGTDSQFRMGARPWEDIGRYIRNSPVFFSNQVSTPIMLIHGDMDFTKMSQVEEMFTALARQNKDVLFVRYWGEHHIIEQPQNQRDMWIHIFSFLNDNGVTANKKIPM